MAGDELEIENFGNGPKPKQMIQTKNTQPTHHPIPVSISNIPTTHHHASHESSSTQSSSPKNKNTSNPPIITQSPHMTHSQPPKGYPQTWASTISLRHHIAARPHLMHGLEEQIKVKTRKNTSPQSPEFIKNLLYAGPTSNFGEITVQPVDDGDKDMADDTQANLPSERQAYIISTRDSHICGAFSEALSSPVPDGGTTSLDASAQLVQHDALSSDQPIDRQASNNDEHLDEQSGDEPPGTPQSSNSRQEHHNLDSNEHQTKEQLRIAKGKQRAEPEPEPETEDAEGPRPEVQTEIQHRPMNPLFYDDDGSGSDISEERAVPPPARSHKRFRSDSNKSFAADSGDEHEPRGPKRVKSEPIDDDDELFVLDSDDEEGDDDNVASSSRQQAVSDAKERRHQRDKERQIQTDIEELEGYMATIERLYSDRKIMEAEDLNTQTSAVLKQISAKKWHYLREVIEAGRLEEMLLSMTRRKKSYDEHTRDLAYVIRDAFEQRFEGRSLFLWQHDARAKSMKRCGYARIANPRGTV